MPPLVDIYSSCQVAAIQQPDKHHGIYQISLKKAVEWSGVTGVFYAHNPDGVPRGMHPGERFGLSGEFAMKIQVNQIPAKGEAFEGKEQNDILELNDPVIRPVDSLSYSLFAQFDNDTLLVSGTLSILLELDCVSCLQPFIYALVVRDFSAEIPAGPNDTVDLTPYLREDIVLALPAHPRCDWDGSRVCPGPKIPRQVTEETEPSQPDAWAALDELNLRKKN